jgi:hypothetical protein
VTKKDKKDDGNINSLLLKNSVSNDNKGILKKGVNKNYKDVASYVPTGNLIYNTKLIRKIENVTDNMKK